MARDIISKKTRYKFREYFVGLTLREIEMEFDAADVPFDEKYVPSTSGQRRSLVEQYYHAVDWTKWSDDRKVLTVYENVLNQLEERAQSPFFDNEWAQNSFSSLKNWVEKDGFRYDNGRLIPVGENQALQGMADTAAKFDAPELHRQIERMQSAVEDDPGLAIGTAKELVETTCKIILEQREINTMGYNGGRAALTI